MTSQSISLYMAIPVLLNTELEKERETERQCDRALYSITNPIQYISNFSTIIFRCVFANKLFGYSKKHCIFQTYEKLLKGILDR